LNQIICQTSDKTTLLRRRNRLGKTVCCQVKKVKVQMDLPVSHLWSYQSMVPLYHWLSHLVWLW
jgi:hypothetical protein